MLPIDHEGLAFELWEAERSATPVELLTDRHPGLTWEDARAVARATDALRLADGGQPIGYKLGWTSAQMREALGIDRPNWGTLWAAQLTSGPLSCAELIHPKVEPELVHRAAVELSPDMTAADIAATGGEWALGIEVVDPRFPSFEFDWLDNTADNSSSARVIVGPFHRPSTPPADLVVTFGPPGDEREGTGANALGDPYEAVAWLARSLAAEGTSILAGQIVFTGGLTAPFDLVPGSSHRVAADGFEPVLLVAS